MNGYDDLGTAPQWKTWLGDLVHVGAELAEIWEFA